MVRKCVFCSTLFKEYLKMTDVARAKLEDMDSPIYDWTIRTTAKSRESKNSIVVSFHKRPPIKTADAGAAASAITTYTAMTEERSSGLRSQQSPVRFHFVSNDDLGEMPTKDDIGPTTDPASKGVGKQIVKWIRDCNQNHAKCIKAAKTTWVPTRLLDLQFGDGSSVRLIKTREEGTKGPYVTLSHCWGPKKDYNIFTITLGETEELYKSKGVEVSTLSTNFQQAISVARHIGIRYIWIDST
jgi:hypothetical protein